MRITPLDVRKQEFRKAVRGFDCDEVRAFLSTLADEYETVLVDNKQIRERLADQDEKLADYQKMEKNLRDTLMTAERVMQETKESAARKGEVIVQEAQVKAQGILEECRLRTEELRREITGLRKEKETYLARFRSLAEAQIQFIDTHRSDFEDLDKRLTDIVDSVVTRTGTAGVETEPVVPAAPPATAPEVAMAPPPPPVASAPIPAAGDPVSENDIWRDYQPGSAADEEAAPFEPAHEKPAAAQDAPAPEAAPVLAETDLNGMLAETLTETAADVAAGMAQQDAPSDAQQEEPTEEAQAEDQAGNDHEKPLPGFGPGGGLEPVVTDVNAG